MSATKKNTKPGKRVQEDIAVIGMSGLFPGSETLEQFWDKLVRNEDCRSAATEKQMGRDPKKFLGSPGVDDRFYCIDGGYINDFLLSNDELGLSQEELDKLDDVYRWSLYVAREALKDSGYLNKTGDINAGVILGNLSFPTKKSNQLFIPTYHKAINSALVKELDDESLVLPRFAEAEELTSEAGLLSGYPAALIAKIFSLKASSFCLDAACASSLYSVKLACDYLHTGRSELMLAGAVSAADPFFVNLGFSVFHAYPENSVSAPLDKRSQGLFAGEGAGILVLKRYKDALIDGDNIRAVIRGGGLSNDGKGQHVLSPNTKGQVKAFERAYEAADIDPATVEYIECHATGTPLGDKVELTSLENFFTPYLEASKREAPMIGSVKSNLGHLLSAAGMPAMVKVIMAMDKEFIPASVNIEQKQSSPNKVFSEDKICSENKTWESVENFKRAGVSVFGFGGANAHMVFEQQPKDKVQIPAKKQSIKPGYRKMAILGMDAHFGECENLASFEKLLMEDKHVFKSLPAKRWRGLEDEALIQQAFQNELPQGGFIEDFDLDFLNFKLPPHIEERLIPQQLLLMKVADRALQDAQIETGGRVAVLVAMGTELELHQIRARVNLDAQFEEMWQQHPGKFTQQEQSAIEALSKNSIHHKARLNQYTSAIGNIMASRISSLWDFSGPAFTVSAEENSVFQAVELAQLMFERGEAEAVVVAAVDLSASMESLLLRQHYGAIQKQGKGFSFDISNKGWNVGEGAGAIVLKASDNLSESEQEKVYAQIDALAFSEAFADISTGASNGDGLIEASKQALQQCDYKFSNIEYWELCASGFPEQDESELAALLKLAKPKAKKTNEDIAIGSVKNNVGHAFSASGIASIIKTALCLHNRMIPGVSTWQSPKDKQRAWQKSSLYIPQNSKIWFKDKHDEQRIAAVNSLSRDGRSAFLSMSENKSTAPRKNHYLFESEGQLFACKGNNEKEIIEQLDVLKEMANSYTSLGALASDFYYQEVKKNTAAKSLSLVVNRLDQLEKEITLAKKGVEGISNNNSEWYSPTGSYYTTRPMHTDGGKDNKIVFVYPGAFNSYLDIAKDLGLLFPELHDIFSRHSGKAATLFADKLYYPRSLNALSDNDRKALQRRLPDEAISSFENGISVSVALTDVLKNILGVKPDMSFGYSMGEVSMMYALEVWGTTDEMSQRLRSNPVFQTRLAGPMNTLRETWKLGKDVADGSFWTGFALLAPIDKIKKAVAKEKFVRLILINTNNEAVIAGKPDDCRRVADSLGCDYFEAALGDVIHCDWVRNDYEDLSALHVLDVNAVDNVQFFTAVGNQQLKISSQGVADNIAEMYCNPVDFVALTEKVYDENGRIFIELGARDNCTRHINSILKNKEHVSVSLNRKGSSDKNNLLRAIAKLYSHGVDINLERLYKPKEHKINKKQLIVNIEVGGKRLFDELRQLKSLIADKPESRDLPGKESSTFLDNKNKQFYRRETEEVVKVLPLEKKTITSNKQVSSNHVVDVNSASANTSTKATQVINTKIPASIISGFNNNARQVGHAHEAFLDSRKQNLKQLGQILEQQLTGVSSGHYQAPDKYDAHKLHRKTNLAAVSRPEPLSTQENKIANFDQSKVHYPNADLDNVIWGPEDLVEFAEGKIANVFGDEYKIIDTYKRRVRLPTTEYLLVDRVTKLDAKINRFEPCSMTTEYDVPYDFWYSVKGQIPWAVAVESGQCDLLLISYLGIDFLNKGERVYRLLDCELTFMDDVAMEGDTLRYHISINSYARSGENFLFFFSYNCYVGDKLVLKMRNGAAGFFCDEELCAGKGVIETESEKKARLAIVKQSFQPLLRCDKRRFDYQDMLSLCQGDLNACFGEGYDQGKNPNLVYSAPKMLMIERITELDPKGGSWGLGLLVGEKTLHPDHWYFPCHFKDDQVMAGSLMSDGCSQLLRFYTWFLGLHTLTEDAVFQPMPGLGQQVRCRGQVSPQHGTLIYRMEITEIGTHPKPYAKANVDIILGDKIVVDFKNLGLFLGEIAGTELEKKILRRQRVLAGDYGNALEPSDAPGNAGKQTNTQTETQSETSAKSKAGQSKLIHENHVYVPGQYPIREHPFAPFPGNPADNNAVPDTLPFTQWHFIEFATGRIANCFGEEFGGIYDGRTPPRTPNADLQLTTRVLEIEGERNELKRISRTLAEFDCPADAWFFKQSTHPDLMPYSIIMEIALQPNGFISAWAGTTLLFPERDLYFRNLDGSGTLLREVDLRNKTIQNTSTLLSTTSAGNTIIQSFKFELAVDGEIFYQGTSVFGYFLKDALTHQLGLDKGNIVKAWHEENQIPEDQLRTLDLNCTESQSRFYQPSSELPYYHLAGPQLNLLDTVVLSKQAGEFQQGYVYAQKSINPNDWFFPCHFHQDPVMPGSLGVEAILQAMQIWTLDNDLGAQFKNPRFVHELSTVNWKYRGQITPDNKIMSLDVHISKIDIKQDKVVIFAKASLYKDGLRIYEVTDAQLALCEAG